MPTSPIEPLTDPVVSRDLGGKPRGTEPAACSVLGGYFDNDYGEWCFQVISTPLWGDMTHWWPLPDLEAQIRTQDEGLVELLREARAELACAAGGYPLPGAEALVARIDTALSSRGQV